MKTTSLRARALACALLATTAYCGLAASPAAAQANAPVFRSLDSNGVDLVRGDFLASFPEGSIGSGEAELALLRMVGATGHQGSPGASQWDHIQLNRTGSSVWVDFGTRGDPFPGAESRGATLSGGGSAYQYRSPDGTAIAFTNPTDHANDISNFCEEGRSQANCTLVPTSITSPDGKTVTLDYEFWAHCIVLTPPNQFPSENDPIDCSYTPRLASVANSFGYAVRFAYESEAGGGGSNPPASFSKRTGAGFFNGQAGSSALAGVAYAYPSAGVTLITDTGGREWRVASGASGHSIRRPGAGSDTIAATLSGGIVTSVVNAGVTANYARSVSGSTATMTVTQIDPNGPDPASVIVSDLALGRPVSVTDPTGRTDAYQYDSAGRLERVTRPEGNYVHFTFDARGNVTQTQAVAKAGSGLATITTSASFDSACANPATCNQPNSTTDERGNVTDYKYHPVHGGIERVTLPAPAPNAVRPQTRYSYTLTNGEYLLTGISQCQTLPGETDSIPAACANGADEVRTALAYDANGNLTSTSSGNGSGTLTATSAMTWDPLGNLSIVDGPLPGSDDKTHFHYDAGRRLVATISPDPDGSAQPLLPRAVRTVFDAATGLPVRTEQGNVADPADPDWTSFLPALAVETQYDVHARPKAQRLVSGGTIHALTQTSYDMLGRPDCVARRMNETIFATIDTHPCDLGAQVQDEGPEDHGPDRIVKTLYDEAGRVSQVRTALDVTGVEAAESTFAYRPNGQVEYVVDGRGNRTQYVYDGHDRLVRTIYPSGSVPTGFNDATAADALATAGAVNTGDDELYGYDPAGNVTAFTNRANETIGFGHDSLGRRTSVDLPGSAVHEYDLAFAYDNLGRMILARDLNPHHPNGVGHAFGHDALGRLVSDAHTHYGTRAFAWDLAGRRTRTTWSDGFFVDYDYDLTGAMTRIRENGATSGAGVLAAFGYDDLGRRVSLTRGNGTSTSYAYDGASRLTGIGADFAGTSYDQILSFDYNPAGQIVSNGRANHGYSFIAADAARADAHNGLNQLVQAGSTQIGHDARGNVNAIGSASYGYTALNRLATAGATELAYDALGRLYFVVGPNTAFVHDPGSGSVIEERAGYTSGYPITRRYVHGPGGDEPLVWYEGSGTSDRRWLHADERGSIVAVSDGSGTGLAANRYDEDGNVQGPDGAGALVGRFGYAGQPWIPELGLSYNRERFYNPVLPLFMQPDPIGWAAGPNGYVYAGGDPVNAVDPNGTTPQHIICTGTRLGCRAHHDSGGSGGSGLSPGSSGTSEYVGSANWAAIKRDPNSVPWTGTGTLTTYSDGTQALTNLTITFGGRFQGVTASGSAAASFVSSDFSGAYLYFRVSPQNDKDFWVGYSQLPMSARPILADRRHLPSGSVQVNVPIDYVPGSTTGNGFLLRAPGSTGDANIFRVMAPNRYTPYPYIVFHNAHGQPISPFSGKTLTRDEWHYPLTKVESKRVP